MLMRAGLRVLSETLSYVADHPNSPAVLSLHLAFSPQHFPPNYHSRCGGFLSAFGVVAENSSRNVSCANYACKSMSSLGLVL